ncbi:MAG TPA: HAD-IA family hydrolase [Myxococcota bacterium]|nr:HAD-IA family hydrolase [Myxococcota bacterium]
MPIDLVLFDLGGVVVELGGLDDMAAFARGVDEEALWRRWLACPWVRRFERGECGPDEFGRGMVEAWSMPVSPETFLEAFARWPKGLLPGAAELVREVGGQRPVACLSNTNVLHAERLWGRLGVHELFPRRFFSHEIGIVKPDPEAFAHAIQALDGAADRILFLDDNQINVDGARAAGLEAERARGVAEARAILVDRGVLERA